MKALRLYRALGSCMIPFLYLYLYGRTLRKTEDPQRFLEKTGRSSRPRDSRPHIWIHAVSVGETISTTSLIEWLEEQRPDMRILLTTTSLASAVTARQRFKDRVLHQYAPIDVSGWVERFLDYWQPSAVLWMESELWPTTLAAIKRRHYPLFLINGRMSSQALQSWRRIPHIARDILSLFTLCIVQNSQEEKHFRVLKAPRIAVGGNLKFVTPPPPYDARQAQRCRKSIGRRPVLAALSTHGEEDSILGKITVNLREQEKLFTILMPRHPGRCPAITNQLRDLGLSIACHSRHDPITSKTDVYLIDTIGDSGLACYLADIAFVGGSLTPHGGHNPLEPIQYGCPVLHGQHTYKFLPMYQELDKSGASLCVTSPQDMENAVRRLLKDKKKSHAMRQAGQRHMQRGKEVLRNYHRLLAPCLQVGRL